MGLPVMNEKLLDGKNVAILLGCGIVAVMFVTWWGKRQLKDVAGGVGGVISGNNVITSGTVYEGQGIAGTIGAAFNYASGGHLEELGSWIGGKMFDLLNKTSDPNNPKTPANVRSATMRAPVRPEDKVTVYAR
jgi:hypothetical protein